ncbi:MAG: DUF4194 domain-containing protein [Candidatus Thiodiazotropha sp.]|jgi:hypothetical protein
MTESTIHDHLEQRIKEHAVSLGEVRELLVRLLNYGILCRDESHTERELYDRFLRIEQPVRELLDLFGIGLQLDHRFEYLRLLPPGAQVPGMEGANEQAFSGSLRARLTQHEVALLLVLRVQYDKALREGRLDEQGFVTESFESLGIAMKNLLGRPLSDKVTERRRLFQRLKQLRLIDFRQEEDIDSGESWLRIHPMIVDFVGEEALATLQEGLPDESQEEAPGEEDTNVS